MFYKLRQGFIYDLLEVKLKSMQKFYSSNETKLPSAKKEAENIEYALYLLNKLRDEEATHNEAFYDFNITYPDFELVKTSEPSEKLHGCNKIVFNGTEEQKRLRWKCYEKQYNLQQQKHNEFWNFIRLIFNKI